MPVARSNTVRLLVPRGNRAPDWTVIVITRDEEATIEDCLRSVFDALAGRSFEVILVDSASTDRTLEVARRFPIRILRLRRGSPLRPSVGRHVGLQQSRGRWILFLDGDSTLDPGWIAPAVVALSAEPAVAGVSGRTHTLLVHPGGRVDMYDQHPDSSYDSPYYLSGSSLYRRSALERAGGFNPFMYACEEIELGARLRKHDFRLRKLRIPMTHHFAKGRAETVEELRRRIRRRFPVGTGQLVRYAVAQRLPLRGLLARVAKPLAFLALSVMGVGSIAASFLLGDGLPFVLWLATLVAIFVAFTIRARSVSKAAYYFLEWFLTGPWVLYGLLARPLPLVTFSLPADCTPEEIPTTNTAAGCTRTGPGASPPTRATSHA